MRRIRIVVSTLALCGIAAISTIGCAPKTEKVEAAEERLQTLMERGAPDSVLFDARMLMADIRNALRATGSLDVGRKIDSLGRLLDRAQSWYDEALQAMGPELAQVKEELQNKMHSISGPNLRVADSIIALADSLVGEHYLLQARDMLSRLEKRLPDLFADEKKGAQLRPQVVGVWREVANPDGLGSTTVLKTTYTFNRDGDMEFQEEKKGQSSDNLKEDWKFHSWGRWEMKGDTVLLRVSRERCERQIYETLEKKGDAMVWERREEPTYDSTITDGAKDRSVLFADLKADFRKIK